MDLKFRSILLACLKQTLVPVVSFCLRRSITIQELIEMVKLAFVEAAARELNDKGEKPNASRLSVATGLHRREVQRIWRGEMKEIGIGHTLKVIGQWVGDPQYKNKAGRPRVLTHDGDDSEFAELVKSVCTDLHAGTVLFELERIGAVERDGQKVKLINEAYMPKGDPEAGFKLYAIDGSHLLESVEENVFDAPARLNLHIRTEYDNIDQAALPEIRDWLYQQGNLLHHKARMFLSKFDLDLTPNTKAKGGGKVVLGSFSRALDAKKFD